MSLLNNYIKIIFLVLLIISSNVASQGFDGKRVVDANKWEKVFKESSVDGTFLLYELYSDTLFAYNYYRANKSYLPASTFKILNSLISLETGVITDENEIIKWDGKKRFYDKWNQDQNLKSAIKYSCVWFYQVLARRIGKERMMRYLNSTGYGNRRMGINIDKFWLEGDLRISAFEQVIFLDKFLRRVLPFSNKNLSIVKNLLLVASSGISKLYAKTGLTARTESQIGWYVGFVETDKSTWIFALNIEINRKKDSKLRKSITEKILNKEGLF